MKRDFYVYCYFRPCGEPCYIGMGRGSRWKAHLTKSRFKDTNRHLRSIIKKAGGNVPFVKLRSGLQFDQAREYEIAFIKAIGREPHGPLVNLTDGGDGTTGYIYTDAHRAKLKAANLGKKASPDTIEKMRCANRGKTQPPSAVAKTAAAHRGRIRPPETITKMRAAKLGKSHNHGPLISKALKGRKFSSSHRAALSAAASLRHSR